MELCSSNGHDEVCYESSFCPVCTAIEDGEIVVKELETTKSLLMSDIDDLEKEIENLKKMVDAG